MHYTITQLRKRRIKTINVLYRYFILKENSLKIKQELLDGFIIETLDENIIEYITDVIDNVNVYKTFISQLLVINWKWQRLPKIIQAILINATYEIKKNITAKAIIINESIEIVRQYLPGYDTSFINGLLDNI